MRRNGQARRWLDRAGVVAAVAWLVACAVLVITREVSGRPDPASLASSATAVAHGQVWTLFTSMLPVSRLAFAELAGCAVTVAVALRLLGGLRFWAVALASHVGSTLVAYAGIGAIWLVAPGAVADVAVKDDYGISAVWLGAIGAIAVVLHRRGRRGAALLTTATTVLASAGLILFSDWLAFVEHLLALAIGAAVAAALTPARAPVAQPVAQGESRSPHGVRRPRGAGAPQVTDSGGCR